MNSISRLFRNSEETGRTRNETGMQISKTTQRHLLTDLFFKLDFRDKNNSGKKKLTGVLAAYLIASAAMSFNFFSVFDRQSFVVLAFTSSVFFLSFLILSDFDGLFLAGSSYDVIASLPLDERNVPFAKFATAIVYLLPFSLVSALPQGVFLYFYNESAADLISFILASVSFSILLASMLVLVYSFVLNKLAGKANLIMTVMQILFFAFVFYSSSVASSQAKMVELIGKKLSIADNPLISVLPQIYLLNAIDNPFYLMILLAVTVLTAGICFKYLSANYLHLIRNAEVLSKNKKSRKFTLSMPESVKAIIEKLFLKNGIERASYYLVADQLSGSAFLRMKYVPYFLMPVMFLIIGLVFGIKNFLLIEPGSPAGFNLAIPVLSPSVTIVMVMSMRMMQSNTKIADESSHDAEWIFNTLPVRNTEKILSGVAKFFYVNFLIPLLVICGIILLVKSDALTAILNTAFVGAGILLMNTIAFSFDKTFPFTLDSGKFNSASKLLEIFLSVILGIVLILIQIFAFQNIIFALVSITVFALLSILLNRN